MRPIRLGWMYPDIMDLYGDRGNIQVFEKRCEWRGIPLDVIKCSIGDSVDLSEVDILFMGGGADREQGVMYQDLISRKEDIKKAMDDGMVCLLICGGYQLFGKYYEDADGKRLEGLGIFEYYTVADGRTRSIGNIAVECECDGETIQVVGFENHGGQTYEVSKPWGKVLFGHGNEKNGYEGYYDGKTLGTYMHGPLLPKNPKIADHFIKMALARQGITEELAPVNDELSNAAREHMLQRLLKK
ncbi:MAG: glutamine amidotransferase [Erysipelotrichales bacterium]|nr:glutamine amidotransferase [Erysipelotrichales bacterium]